MEALYTIFGYLSCMLVGGLVALPSVFNLTYVFQETRQNRGAEAFVVNFGELVFRAFIGVIFILVFVFIATRTGWSYRFAELWPFYVAITLFLSACLAFILLLFTVVLAKVRYSQEGEAEVDILDDKTF